MITLATLAQATAQEVFDQVAKHLLDQGKRSATRIGAACRYRFKDLKCAAGCLIADTEYEARFEQRSWDKVSSMVGCKTHVDLITYLQRVHDVRTPEQWPKELLNLAEYQHLSSEVITSHPAYLETL